MAYIDATAIRTAINEALEGVLTATPRSLTAGLLSGDLAPGATGETVAQRATVTPRFTVALRFDKHPDRPMGPGPLWIDQLTVTVTTSYLLSSQALGRAAYDVVRATSEIVGHVMRTQFEWPGALSATSLAAPTGIIGGALFHQSSTVTRDEPAPVGQPGGGLYKTDHVFIGSVLSTPTATS